MAKVACVFSPTYCPRRTFVLRVARDRLPQAPGRVDIKDLVDILNLKNLGKNNKCVCRE
jgi:hypothetical protein